jgi:sirohydrochlorin ferrochelatase
MQPDTDGEDRSRPTPRSALIVAHGSPADPAPQEARLRALAVAVAGRLPGWRVAGATLAAEGALEAALAGMRAPLVYPFFMAQGWFTGTNLPRRLAAAGAVDARQVAPFGADPDLPGFIAGVVLDAAAAAGIAPRRAALVLAAHGSKVSRRSADTTHGMARMLAARTPFARVTAGFVEEAPFLADAARGIGPGLCLPFFALRAGHVEDDVPQALAEAGFDGPLLPAIGEHPRVPELIARALGRAAV